MKIPKEIEDKFFAGMATAKTKFAINAAVSISDGPYKGQPGSIISIVSIDPQTKYLVELNNGTDVQVDESNLISAV